MLQFTNEKPRISLRMYNKLVRPKFLLFGPPLQLWLSVLMSAVAHVTWDGFLAICL